MAGSTNRVALYAAVGPELTHWEVDVEGAALTRRGAVTLPANIHYAWPHASGRFLYVASSDSASGVGGVVGTKHHVTAGRSIRRPARFLRTARRFRCRPAPST